jgi:hypothetical protein
LAGGGIPATLPLITLRKILPRQKFRPWKKFCVANCCNPTAVRDLVHWRTTVNRLLKPIIYLLAAIYFVVDAVFMAVATPVADWLADRRIFDGLRRWILSLHRYPTLALFAVPVILLEPVKPIAAYLAATSHVAAALGIFVLGEILKLVLLERLFALCRDKLLSISAVAWAYGQYRQFMDWIEATDAWQAVRRWWKMARHAIRVYVLELKASHKRRVYNSATQV